MMSSLCMFGILEIRGRARSNRYNNSRLSLWNRTETLVCWGTRLYTVSASYLLYCSETFLSFSIGPDVTRSSYLAPLPCARIYHSSSCASPSALSVVVELADSNTPPRAQASPMRVLSFCRRGRARAFVKASATFSSVGQ